MLVLIQHCVRKDSPVKEHHHEEDSVFLKVKHGVEEGKGFFILALAIQVVSPKQIHDTLRIQLCFSVAYSKLEKKAEGFEVELKTKEIIWNQFGAALDSLEKAIRHCPEDVWFDQDAKHPFWRIAFHTLFWVDYYLSESQDGFHPPEPFGLEELDPSGAVPERAYSQEELLVYLEYNREKCRKTIGSMTEERASREYHFKKASLTTTELILYNLRHVQHHTAQLNLLLRQRIDSAPRWVFRASTGLFDD